MACCKSTLTMTPFNLRHLGNAISSSNVRVYEVVASPNDPAAGASWNQVSVTPPSYGDISAMTISWAESITLEKDSFTVLAGSTLGSDSQIIASFSSEGDVPGYIPLKIVGSDTSSNNSYYYQLNHNVTKIGSLDEFLGQQGNAAIDGFYFNVPTGQAGSQMEKTT